MDQIPDIQVEPISTFFVPVRPLPTEFLLPAAPPVTVIIGVPVVEMPGCVEWHPDDRRLQETYSNGSLDGSVSLFYNYNQLQFLSYRVFLLRSTKY